MPLLSPTDLVELKKLINFKIKHAFDKRIIFIFSAYFLLLKLFLNFYGFSTVSERPQKILNEQNEKNEKFITP